MRKLHINNEEYKYVIGRDFIKIVWPDKKSKCFKIEEVTGKSQDYKDADFGDYDENRHGNLINWNWMVRPSDIKSFIEKINE